MTSAKERLTWSPSMVRLTMRNQKKNLRLTLTKDAVNGHHIPGTPYNWRHGWEPLNPQTARRHGKPWAGDSGGDSKPEKESQGWDGRGKPKVGQRVHLSASGSRPAGDGEVIDVGPAGDIFVVRLDRGTRHYLYGQAEISKMLPPSQGAGGGGEGQAEVVEPKPEKPKVPAPKPEKPKVTAPKPKRATPSGPLNPLTITAGIKDPRIRAAVDAGIRKVPLGLRDPDLKVLVRPTKLGNPNTAAEYQGEQIIIYEKAFKQILSGRADVDGPEKNMTPRELAEHTIVHELGHGVMSGMWNGGHFLGRAGKDTGRFGPQAMRDAFPELRFLTGYASTHPDEAWAEAFMIRLHDPSRSFGPKSEAIFKELGI